MADERISYESSRNEFLNASHFNEAYLGHPTNGKSNLCDSHANRLSETSNYDSHHHVQSERNISECYTHKKGFSDERMSYKSSLNEYFSPTRSSQEYSADPTNSKSTLYDSCGNRLSKTGNPDWHLESKTIENIFECNTHKKGFTNERTPYRTNKCLNEYFSLSHSNQEFSANPTNGTFTLGDSLENRLSKTSNFDWHLKSQTDNNISGSNTPENIFSHAQVITNTPEKSPVCKLELSQKNMLQKHLEIHSEITPFVCSVCKKVFSLKWNFERHLLTHTGEKPFVCDVCKKGFSQKSGLDSHLRVHSGGKPFFCSVCNKAFSQKSHLESHLRVHSGDKPFVCSVCKKRFSKRCNLKTHLRTHTGERPFVCSECKKAFSESSKLRAHLRTHTGEKPFVCDVCTKGFSRWSTLRVHHLTHTGERPFVCDVCTKGFSQRSMLRAHLHKHTGEKPFVCDVCAKRFSRRSTLQVHLRTHTG